MIKQLARYIPFPQGRLRRLIGLSIILWPSYELSEAHHSPLTTHRHLVPTLRTRGSIPPLLHNLLGAVLN